MTTLTNYWSLTADEQNRIKDAHPILIFKTYKVTGRLNIQAGIESMSGLVKEVVIASGKDDAVERVEKLMTQFWFNSERLKHLVECYGFKATWLNEDALVETLVKTENGADYWIEE